MRIKALIMLSLSLLLISCQSIENVDATIAVSASGTVSQMPDSASLRIYAESYESTTEWARVRTSQMINNAVNILRGDYGVKSADIVTETLSINPYYEWIDGKRMLVSQRASQSINVLLRDIDSIGSIIEDLSQLDGIAISSIQLDVLDKTDMKREARMLAVEEARAKADAYAESAGMKVGEVISISDGTSISQSYRSASSNMMMAKATAESASVSTEYYAGRISVTDSVSIIYELIK